MLKKYYQSFIAAFVALFLSLGFVGQAAAGQISNPTGLVYDLSADSLMPLFTEMNMSPEKFQTDDGKSYIVLTEPDSGLTIVAIPEACTSGKCIGVNFVVIFSDSTLANDRITYFNSTFSFVKVVKSEESNRVEVYRYEIADFGIPRGNLRESVMNLVALSKKVRAEL